MRQKLTVSINELVGTNLNIGIEQGENIDENEQYYLLKKSTANVNSNDAISILEKYAEGLLDEINGVACGLSFDIDTTIRMYSGYNLTFPSMGCTTYADEYYVRNYDFTPELYDARIVFIKPTVGYASVGFSQQVVGRLDGMNEHGLVIGLHLVNEKHSKKGLTGTTIVRLVLDQCRNVQEAINLISDLPHSHCYNFSLLDQDGNKCVIEATPEEQVVRKSPLVICTNHFEAPKLADNNRTFINGSIQRKEHLQSFQSKSYTPEEAYRQFNDESSPLFYTNYQQYFGTLHTVVYIPESLEVLVGIGGNAEPVKYSFKEWLEGKSIDNHKVIGSIEV